MQSIKNRDELTPALKRAVEEGIDLTQLYERLRLTPTERLRQNFQMAGFVEELRKAGQKHRDRNRR